MTGPTVVLSCRKCDAYHHCKIRFHHGSFGGPYLCSDTPPSVAMPVGRNGPWIEVGGVRLTEEQARELTLAIMTEVGEL